MVIAGAMAIGLAMVTGPAFGSLVGIQTEASCSPTEMWCELGAVLAGAIAGAIISVITYVVTATVAIVRLRPRGQRARGIATLLLVPVVLAALLSLLVLAPGW